MPVYRYRWDGTLQSQIQNEVPGSPTLGSIAPPTYIDINLSNAAYKDDLDASMSARGYVYDSTDPVITVAQATSQTADSQLSSVSDGMPDGAYRVITGSAFPSNITWWVDNTMVKKIKSKDITWSGAFPSSIVEKVYAADGTTILYTVTDAITYSGAFETHRTRTIT